eukprot:8464273-Pyramimonas_sp.AAC.2
MPRGRWRLVALRRMAAGQSLIIPRGSRGIVGLRLPVAVSDPLRTPCGPPPGAAHGPGRGGARPSGALPRHHPPTAAACHARCKHRRCAAAAAAASEAAGV